MMYPVSIPADGKPGTAEAAGLEPRFRFWRGLSGRRYLFTEVTAETLRHFEGVVLVLTETDAHGRISARWAGSLEGRGALAQQILRDFSFGRRLRAFVHLLGTTPRMRGEIVEDIAATSVVAEPMRRAA